MKLSVEYTNRETSESGPLGVAFDPTSAAGARSTTCRGFVFGSESHPDDFRCQNCHHFAWSGHPPAAAWVGASDAPERLALAAMIAVLGGAAASPELLETLKVWLPKISRRGPRDEDIPIIVDFARFAGLTYGL